MHIWCGDRRSDMAKDELLLSADGLEVCVDKAIIERSALLRDFAASSTAVVPLSFPGQVVATWVEDTAPHGGTMEFALQVCKVSTPPHHIGLREQNASQLQCIASSDQSLSRLHGTLCTHAAVCAAFLYM